METEVITSKIKRRDIPYAIFVFSDNLNEVPEELESQEVLRKSYQNLVKEGNITGKSGEVLYYQYICNGEFERIYYVGLGEKAKPDMEHYRVAGAVLCSNARKLKQKVLSLQFPDFSHLEEDDVINNVHAFIEGVILRNYEFIKYRKEPAETKLEKLIIYEEDLRVAKLIEKGIYLGKINGEATNYCRDIANEPSNVMSPVALEDKAREIANKYYDCMEFYSFGKEGLQERGMGLFLGVAQSESKPPRVITLKYKCKKENAKTLAIIGKGITFDSGGISLKTGPSLFLMKRDLSGGASTLAIMKAVGELRPNINVIGIIGATENMPGPKAYKPGDILRSMSGKTVEVLNTDAEGRLVLADVFTYVQRELKPDFLVDVSTLTGSMEKALGHSISGVISNNKKFLSLLLQASQKSNEHIWPMPLTNDYKKNITSFFADLKNISNSPPDALLAGFFLYQFIENDIPWIHLDIAGTDTASGEPKTYYPRGATGVTTRTLIELVKIMSELEEFPAPIPYSGPWNFFTD